MTPGRAGLVGQTVRLTLTTAADCGRSARDGVRLRELRLLSDPTAGHICGPDDEDECQRIWRAETRRVLTGIAGRRSRRAGTTATP